MAICGILARQLRPCPQPNAILIGDPAPNQILALSERGKSCRSPSIHGRMASEIRARVIRRFCDGHHSPASALILVYLWDLIVGGTDDGDIQELHRRRCDRGLRGRITARKPQLERVDTCWRLSFAVRTISRPCRCRETALANLLIACLEARASWTERGLTRFGQQEFSFVR
jgi:hypothetical protein